MNKKYIVLAVAIIGASVLYKRSMEGMKPSESSASASALADMVTLISNDGKKFQISQKAAEQSHVLNTLLGGNAEKTPTKESSIEEKATEKEFPLKYINGDALEKMVSLLEELKTEKDKREDGFNLDNFVIEMFGRSDIQELPDRAIAANYLQVEGLANSLMRFYIFITLKASPKTTVSDIQKTVNKPVLDRIIQKEYSVVESSAGFKALGIEIDSKGRLDLSSKGITNTYGLFLLHDKDKILELYLSKNQLENLPVGVFNGFTNLQELGLYDNQLKDLPAGIFNGLTKLQVLLLSNNKLENLPAGVFNELSSLQQLHLSHTHLEHLPIGVFNVLSNLRGLWLDHNQLKDLPVGIFNGLINLRDLALNFNQLKSLPAGIFNGLTNLLWFNLDKNPLESLPVGIFNGLTNLQTLSLYGNQLKDLPAGIFHGLTNLQTLVLYGNNLEMTVDQIRELLDSARRDRVQIRNGYQQRN